MVINSSQAANAYATAPNTTSAVDNSQQKGQHTETVKTDLNTENSNNAQKPFEVNITKEAQDRLEAQTNQEQVEKPDEEQTKPPETQTAQTSETEQETSQIVNIVA